MADYATQTDAEAKKSIKKCAERFLSAYYQHEIGLFLSDWDDHYKNLKLEDFQRAAPKENFMLLPGMRPSLNISQVVTQTLAQLWLSFRTVGNIERGQPLTARIRTCAEDTVKTQAVNSDESEQLKQNLVNFISEFIENEA